MHARKLDNYNDLVKYISQLVMQETGNVLGSEQEHMVQTRLKKRLHQVKIECPNQYIAYLNQNYASELKKLISLLTTHHTFFFREYNQFEFLTENFEQIIENVNNRRDKTLRVLSLGCSRGQEVYSLAMHLNYHLEKHSGIDFEIIGVDIDEESLNFAKKGVYYYHEVKSIPMEYQRNNWKRGTGSISQYAKVKDHLKAKCDFKYANLKKLKETFNKEHFDIIFCRNVFIYFDNEDIEIIVKNIKDVLLPSGILFTGLCESLKNLQVYTKSLAPSVYKLHEMKATSKEVVPFTRKPFRPAALVPLKVLVVDDSPIVVKLMKKIFSDSNQYNVVGTAANGQEAFDFLKNNKVDIMTLDIHMPVMDGIEYLEKHYNDDHPTVVMVSSVDVENQELGKRSLQIGASDFIEKPTFQNLENCTDEILMKLKIAHQNKSTKKKPIESINKTRSILKVQDDSLRVFISEGKSSIKLMACIKELKSSDEPTIIFTKYTEHTAKKLSKHFEGVKKNDRVNNKDKIQIIHFDQMELNIKRALQRNRLSIGIFDCNCPDSIKFLSGKDNTEVMIEESLLNKDDFKSVADHIFPWTSFVFVGSNYLRKR